MKTSPSTALASALRAVLAFLLLLTAQAAPIRIMPMGDSITDGSSFDSPDGTGGYRGPLYNLLVAAGHEIDYVGSQTVNSGLLVEKEHEGHGGWRIDQLDSNVATWFSTIDPDIILLHIGTNDFGQNYDITNAINRLDALITKMAGLRPNAHIIVTNLMARGEPANTNIQTYFNPFVVSKVNDQAALGRRVSFLDMRSAVPLIDMPDNLHPNQTGYDKMAAAWFGAISTILEPGSDVPPALVRASGSSSYDQVVITFNKRLDPTTAQTATNYALSGGRTVLSAVLDATERCVTLTTTPQTPGTTYTVTVNNVADLVTPTPNVIAPNSTVQFIALTQPGYSNNVAESDCYTLVYSLDIPNSVSYKTAAVPYSIDNHEVIGTYDRIAYYMELQAPDGDLRYAWASMDAFDTNPAHIGVPTLAAGVTFQQSVSNLNVVSNVPGVTTGSGQTGNLEFWPTNYQAAKSPLSPPTASDAVYDFGDTKTAGDFGSMQVHNTTAAQTVISFSRWGGSAGDACVGIGNNPNQGAAGVGGNQGVDWTFCNNAAGYSVKKIQVLVRTTGDHTAPTLVSARAGFDNRNITVTFSEPVRRDTLLPANFSLDHGATVTDVTADEDSNTIYLTTTTLPANPLTLTVSNVRDTSANANAITPASTIAVAAAALPPEVTTNIGAAAAGYELVYSLDIPVTGNFDTTEGPAYSVNTSAKPGSFSRVAYYLELQSGATVNYVWASMDAFTQDKRKIGIPTYNSGASFQQKINNLEVLSNKAGITTGSGITTGNIEFWSNSYTAATALAGIGGSGSNFDFNDTPTSAHGYGSMQVHNHGASQTLFALNHFGTNGSTLDLGIGNDSTPTNGGVDWTFAANAGTEYSRRTLHVMILPGLPPEVAANVGAPANGYELVYSLDIPATGNFANTGGPAYAVNNSAVPGSFSRVAYYLELQTGTTTEYIWTSMDAFTGDKNKIGIPTLASGAFFQRKVNNLEVVSNKAGIVTGSGIATGNIEFWPSNYNESNAISIPNASASAYDFGDGGTSATSAGYGSMQVHNHDLDGAGPGITGQTLFALNHFGTNGNTLCLGIGNDPNTANGTDWTFEDNAAGYTKRTLHVLVLPVPLPASITTNVPESADYELVYSLDIPATGNLAVAGAGFTDYTLKNDSSTTPFNRVAYYMELQKAADPQPTFVWCSMDAFTTQRTKIGVPTLASGAYWQRYVSNMNVVSNSPNVTNGSGLTGNLEFWPGNYNGANDKLVAGATGAFDFGDGGAVTNTYGHGSMQVHNYLAKETLFAINKWGNNTNTTNILSVGIGNQNPPGLGDTDWTFAYNADQYTLRRLHVLVRPAPDAPSITRAVGSTTLDRLIVTFANEVTDASAVPANFTISGGITVTGATLLAGNREIALTTSPQTGGTLYTVTVSGVQNRSIGSFTLPGASTQFTAYTPPADLALVPETGYELVYHLPIPANQPQWNLNPVTYSVDEARYGERLFNRVAYLMKLDGNWVYASFDPHTKRIAQIGVPSLQVSSTAFQQIVANMTVASNVPAIATGTGIATGNIEFWGGNYEQANALGIPNASASAYDWGDRMTSGGHGSMQIHNHGASQTLFGYSNWGSNSGGISELGLGNDPAPVNGGIDWTHHANANSYGTRNLYVLVRPGGTPGGAPPEIAMHPCDRNAPLGANASFAVSMVGNGPFSYQWRRNGVPISGATQPWLTLPSITLADVATYDVVVTGSNLVATVSNPGYLTLTGWTPTPLQQWRIDNGFDPIDGSASGEGDTQDKEGDGLVNLLEFGFGTDPNLADNLPLLIDGSRNGTPVVDVSSGVEAGYFAVFTRRKDHGQPGSVEYTVQFSGNLSDFHSSTDTPVFVVDSAADAAYEIVKVPYPLLPLDGQKARFFRVVVTAIP